PLLPSHSCPCTTRACLHSASPCPRTPLFFSMIPRPPSPTLFPYTTLFRSVADHAGRDRHLVLQRQVLAQHADLGVRVVRHDDRRSEEHTSELQSRRDLVCRLLLEKKKKDDHNARRHAGAGKADREQLTGIE